MNMEVDDLYLRKHEVEVGGVYFVRLPEDKPDGKLTKVRVNDITITSIVLNKNWDGEARWNTIENYEYSKIDVLEKIKDFSDIAKDIQLMMGR